MVLLGMLANLALLTLLVRLPLLANLALFDQRGSRR